MSKIMITLNQIKANNPCASSWKELLAHFGKTDCDDIPFPASIGLDVCGREAALWAMKCFPEYDNMWRLFAVWCAKQVAHLQTDERPKSALVVAERHALGKASSADLDAARDAAWAAAGAAAWAAARDAARDAAWAAQTKTLSKLLDTGTIEIDGWLYYIDE